MRSNTALIEHPAPPYEPKPDQLEFYFFKQGKFERLDFQKVILLSAKTVCQHSFVFRFQLQKGVVYFTGSDEAYLRLKTQGKDVRTIYELFEIWRQVLVMKGFPRDTSIYHWRIEDISILMSGLTVFAGSKANVVSLQ